MFTGCVIFFISKKSDYKASN